MNISTNTRNGLLEQVSVHTDADETVKVRWLSDCFSVRIEGGETTQAVLFLTPKQVHSLTEQLIQQQQEMDLEISEDELDKAAASVLEVLTYNGQVTR